jgi:hypothetical protein
VHLAVLDGIMSIALKNTPALLAEWKSATRIEPPSESSSKRSDRAAISASFSPPVYGAHARRALRIPFDMAMQGLERSGAFTTNFPSLPSLFACSKPRCTPALSSSWPQVPLLCFRP